MRKSNAVGRTFIIPTGTEENVVGQAIASGPLGFMIALFSETVYTQHPDDIRKSLQSDVFAMMGTTPRAPISGGWTSVGNYDVAEDAPIQAYGWADTAKNYEDSIEKAIGREESENSYDGVIRVLQASLMTTLGDIVVSLQT